MNEKFRFSRVLLKLSGEALKGPQEHGYDADAVRTIVERIKTVADQGVEIALVVGAGNIWRGVMGRAGGMDRVNADYMGMLATVMNALCLRDFFRAAGIEAIVQCSIGMEPIAPRFNREEAIRALEAGKIVIFAGGTGSPFFTTDTTSALRALETDCDAVLKATKVDGIYTADPFKDPNAVRFPELSFDEALARQLKVMDSTAFSMCRDNDLPIIVFNSIKRHLRNQGASRNITYDDERLDRCVKRLMDMAVNTSQNDWLLYMRPILMEELNMTREMVYTQSIIGDTYNYLNDIKWGPAQTVQVAIGQSITVVTPAAVSRYVAALGNGGKVYNLMIVDSITSPEGEIVSQRTPSLFNEFEGAEKYLPYILEGMKGVVDESGTAAKYFRSWAYRNMVCAKTGTAEVTTIDLENNAWFVMLAPYESEIVNGVPTTVTEPEIAVVVFIPSGFSGGEASMAAREFVGWYMDQKTLRDNQNSVFPGGNQLAP